MANQIVVSAGAKVRNLSGVLTATSGVVSFLPIDVSLGIPQLDVNGKILVSQLPNSVMEYKGTWNVSTNTPTLVNGTGNQGDVYLVEGAAVGGTAFNFGAGPITFFNGDQAIYSGSIWQRASGSTGTVTSVAVTETGDSLNITGSPITTSGTINIGFNGTNLQYVNGAGNLTTFPILTGYVPYTGATANVDLGVFDLTADLITGATGSFASSGGSDTFAINHSSGSGIALNITKGGNGEGLYINKTSGSGNAATIVGTLNATTLVKSGGTSSQFLKADGTIDSNTYALDSAVVHNTGNETIGGTKTFSDATKNNGGIFLQNASSNSLAGYMNIGGLTNGVKFTSGGGISNTFTLPSATGYTFTFPSSNGTVALTSDISYPVTSVFGRTGAVVATSGDYTTAQVTESGNLYFTDSRARLALSLTTTGTSGAATYNNTTGVFNIPNYAPDLSGYVTLAGSQTITGAKTFSTFTKFDGGVILKNNVSASLAGYVGLSAYSASGNKGINIDFDTYSASFYFSGTLPYQYTFPAATGTIALVGGSGVGTVTSVAMTVPTGLSVSGSPITTSGTLAVSLASGYSIPTTSSQATWDTAYSLRITTASLPLVLIGNLISMNQATALQNGFLTYTDFTTFNNKQGTITLTTTGSSGVATLIANTLNIPNYGSALSGYLPLSGGTLTGALNGTSAVFSSSVTATGNGVTNSAIIANNITNSVAQYYQDFTAGATVIGRILRGNGASGYEANGLNIDNYSGMQIKLNTLGGSGGTFVVTGGAATFSSSVDATKGTFTSAPSLGGEQVRAYSNSGANTSYGGLLVLNSTGKGGYLTSGDNSTTTWYGAQAGYVTLAGTAGAAMKFRVDADDTKGITIATTGAATFSSSVTATSESSLFKEGFRINATTTGGGGSQPAYTYYTAAGSKRWSTFLNVGDDKFHIANASNSELFTITQGGNVGIGTSSPNFKTHISTGSDTSITQPTAGTYGLYIQQNTSGNVGGLYIQDGASNSGNSIYVGDNNGAARFVLNTDGILLIGSSTVSGSSVLQVTGSATFSSSVTASSFFESSDSRLKTLIQDNYQTKGIASITPKLYTKNGKVELGYYAQDFVGILDSAVSKGSDDMLSLSYREVHTAKIYALEQEIKDLKAKMN